MKSDLEEGKILSNTFHKLDKQITGQTFLNHDDEGDIQRAYKILVREIEDFNETADDFITRTGHKTQWLQNQDREYVNDFEMDAPALNDFYSYGITVEQIVKEYSTMISGSSEKRKNDNKFHYIPQEKILYRNNTELSLRSKFAKNATVIEIVFEKDPEPVPAIDIQEKWEEKNEGEDIDLDPYKWVRKACNNLNSQVRKKFEIDYDLFIKENERIRLNPKAK